MRIPSQINVAQSHCSRKLHRVATPKRAKCEKILPRNHRNTKRSLEPNLQEREVNKVLETSNATTVIGKKFRDIGIHVYNVRETIFSDQTGTFPKQSQRGYKYIMVMVKIDSNTILVEPMKSRKDEEIILA